MGSNSCNAEWEGLDSLPLEQPPAATGYDLDGPRASGDLVLLAESFHVATTADSTVAEDGGDPVRPLLPGVMTATHQGRHQGSAARSAIEQKTAVGQRRWPIRWRRQRGKRDQECIRCNSYSSSR